MGDATSSPGRTRAASPATRSRPGPTTVKGIKAKMPRWRAARRGVHRKCTSPSGVIRTPRPEQSGQCALSARRPPRFRGRRKKRNAGDPLAQSRNRGRFSFDSTQLTQRRGYANEWAEIGRAAPQRSLPPCGGGTGRGVRRAHCTSFASEANKEWQTVVSSLRKGASVLLGASWPPLSLSLPHKGGGNRVAHTFATHAMCARSTSTAVAYGSAGANAGEALAKRNQDRA
jgi:hypothetical protein